MEQQHQRTFRIGLGPVDSGPVLGLQNISPKSLKKPELNLDLKDFWESLNGLKSPDYQKLP